MIYTNTLCAPLNKGCLWKGQFWCPKVSLLQKHCMPYYSSIIWKDFTRFSAAVNCKLHCVNQTYLWKFLLQVLFRDRHLQVANKNSSFLRPLLLNPFPISLPLSLLFRHPWWLRNTSFRFWCHGNTSGRSFWLPWWFSFHGDIGFGNINCTYRKRAKMWKMQILGVKVNLFASWVEFRLHFLRRHLLRKTRDLSGPCSVYRHQASYVSVAVASTSPSHQHRPQNRQTSSLLSLPAFYSPFDEPLCPQPKIEMPNLLKRTPNKGHLSTIYDPMSIRIIFFLSILRFFSSFTLLLRSSPSK